MRFSSQRRPALLISLLTLSLGTALLFSGCGGGGGGSSLSTTDDPTALASTASATIQGDSIGNGPINNTAAVTSDTSADALLEPTETRGTVTVTIDKVTAKGLHVVGTYGRTYDPLTKTLTVTDSVHTTGTFSDPGNVDDGDVVDMTKTSNLTNDLGTVEHSGTVIRAGVTYTIDDKQIVSKVGTVVTVESIRSVLKNGVSVYSKDVTQSLDRSTAVRPVRTMNGTIHWTKSNGTEQLTIQYTNLNYKVTYTAGVQTNVQYLSGTNSSVTITHVINTITTVTTLTPQTDLSLSGPIVQNGVTIGTISIAGGWVASGVKK